MTRQFQARVTPQVIYLLRTIVASRRHSLCSPLQSIPHMSLPRKSSSYIYVSRESSQATPATSYYYAGDREAAERICRKRLWPVAELYRRPALDVVADDFWYIPTAAAAAYSCICIEFPKRFTAPNKFRPEMTGVTTSEVF